MDIYIYIIEVNTNFILILNKSDVFMIIIKNLYLRIIYDFDKK